MTIQTLCPHCNTQSVVRDALAAWNPTTKTWELQELLDTFSCTTCNEDHITPLFYEE